MRRQFTLIAFTLCSFFGLSAGYAASTDCDVSTLQIGVESDIAPYFPQPWNHAGTPLSPGLDRITVSAKQPAPNGAGFNVNIIITGTDVPNCLYIPYGGYAAMLGTRTPSSNKMKINVLYPYETSSPNINLLVTPQPGSSGTSGEKNINIIEVPTNKF